MARKKIHQLEPFKDLFRDYKTLFIVAGLVLIGLLVVVFWLTRPETVQVSGYPTSPKTEEAMRLYSKNKLTEAENIYEAVVEEEPGDYVAWNGLGNILRDQGNFQEAEEAYLRVISLKPAFEFVYRNLLTLYRLWPDVSERDAKLESFGEIIQKGLSANGRSVNILDAAANYYRLIGNEAKAKEMEEQISQLSGKSIRL